MTIGDWSEVFLGIGVCKCTLNGSICGTDETCGRLRRWRFPSCTRLLPQFYSLLLISWACRKWPPRAMRFGPAYYFSFGGRAGLDVSKLVPGERWILLQRLIDDVDSSTIFRLSTRILPLFVLLESI